MHSVSSWRLRVDGSKVHTISQWIKSELDHAGSICLRLHIYVDFEGKGIVFFPKKEKKSFVRCVESIEIFGIIHIGRKVISLSIRLHWALAITLALADIAKNG